MVKLGNKTFLLRAISLQIRDCCLLSSNNLTPSWSSLEHRHCFVLLTQQCLERKPLREWSSGWWRAVEEREIGIVACAFTAFHCTATSWWKKTNLLLFFLAAAINFRQVLCISFSSAHLPTLHVKWVQLLPSQKTHADFVSLSPCGYEKCYMLFHYTVRKDIFTILKEQAKAQWHKSYTELSNFWQKFL